ncbi:MAG: VWA domain-containing protein [Gemmatimonadales bacterium]
MATRAAVRVMRAVRTSLWALAIAGATTTDGAAQGWIEPGVDRGGFAVDRTRSEVVVRVEGRVAQIEVSEWFVNRGRRLAEGDYLYPLPGEAVFQGFSLFQGDAELRGEIMDAERARHIYEEIVRKRADPALIELAGHGLLRARIFPIQPGEERRVTLRYTQVLERAGNALQLVYAGAVRGQGGNAIDPHGPQHDRQPDGRRPESVRGSFEVRVADASQFLEPFSPTHEIEVDRDRESMTISVDDGVEGRLSLFLPLAGDAVGISVATHRPAGEDGYFMLTLSPGRDDGARTPRDVTVVLDVSGSMSGEKIEQARQAMHQLLGTLSSDDRFRLVSFSSAVQAQSTEWSFARGDALTRARSWIDRLVADGGTNIGAALDEAFRLESPDSRLPVVLFLTDGLPSVGEESPERLAEIAERRAGRARVFAFGVGHDVNTHLLDRLGEAGRGDTDYVQPGENVERVISLLATKIRNPVLTDLELDGGRLRIDEIYPVRIPDVFTGEELVLFGRFSTEGRGESRGRLTVRGRRAGRALAFVTDVTLPEESSANAYIPRLWAARKLGHLERQIWTEGETRSLVEEIRTLALRYGLPSRYTAYLVEEPDMVADMPLPAGGGRRMPVGAFGQSAAPAAPSAATGAGAVRAAESARERRLARNEADLLKAQDEMAASLGDREDARAVAGRLFTTREGVWTDAAHTDATRTIRVKSFTAAYFDLLRALPELEPVLRELSDVVVAGERVSVRVGSEGVESLSAAELAGLVTDFRGM